MFIALEGIGGSGKGTVKTRMADMLVAKNIPHVLTREPGGTPIAERLRTLVREGFAVDGQVQFATPMATALLFNAARSEHVVDLIQPSLNNGKVVICDRFCDSTFTYQSVFMGIEVEKLKQLHDLVIGVRPDVTFLLDCPAEIAMARVTDFEKSRDQFDRAGVDKQERMREVYLELSVTRPGLYHLIDASGTPESVWEQIEPLFLKAVSPVDYIYSS